MTKRLLSLLVLCACGSSQDAAAPIADAGADAPLDDGASDAASDGGANGSDASTQIDASAAECAPFVATPGATTKWASVGTSGRLAYATLPTGERLVDFSNAGYGGGGVALPDVPAKQTVSPSGGDDAAAIQSAIDAVSRLPLVNGVRGAVVLAPGNFHVGAALTIAASGVVLRGSGSKAQGTLVTVTGAPRTFLVVSGAGSWKPVGATAKITDAYVPSGARTFHVDDAAGLAVGASVLVDRPVTAAWVHFMGMDTLVRNGAPETWLAVGSVIHADRVITGINGNAVTVDAPITDSFDARYTAATVSAYTFDGRITNVGVEGMHVVAPMQTVPIGQPTYDAIAMDAVTNGWIRDVVADEFTEGFGVGATAKWITIADATVTRTAPIDNSQGYPFHYSIDGQATLVLRSTSIGNDVFSYATKSRTPGPNAVFQFTARGTHTNVQPHERWATGLLLDAIDAPTSGIGLMNRGWDGTGHGWTIGFGVVWNSVANNLLIQQPPGAQNWAIGTSGTVTTAAAPGSTDPTPLPSGIIDAHATPVAPKSLYLAQLCERLGRCALANIGY